MQTLKNKILIKLIFIISILMIVALNLFGKIEESIEFKYYNYTNKIYHSTLKTEIIPSEYVFINTYSFITTEEYNKTTEEYKLYNLKTKEKKLFYITNIKVDTNYNYLNEYYDINGNLTTNWTDENMEANGFYEITNNRFGETFYYLKGIASHTINITKRNDYTNYIQKAYKYSLTQPEIINKKDRGIYLFRKTRDKGSVEDYNYNIVSFLCFQNEYYYSDRENYNNYNEYGEYNFLNYDNRGSIIFNRYYGHLLYSYWSYNDRIRQWRVRENNLNYYTTNTIYFKLNDKSFIKPTWNEFTNRHFSYAKEDIKQHYYDLDYYNKHVTNIHYSKEAIEYNLKLYRNITNINFLGFIPIEEFEYYLLAD